MCIYIYKRMYNEEVIYIIIHPLFRLADFDKITYCFGVEEGVEAGVNDKNCQVN